MLISIVIPVYNAERFLDRAIKSVVQQSYNNLEVILVNDGSSDASLRLCEEWAANDHRIKLVSQPNRGPAAARNNGLRRATGEYVFFLDADDYIDHHALEVLVHYQKEHQSDLVIGNFSKLESNGRIVKQDVAFHPDNLLFTGRFKSLSKSELRSYIRHFFKFPSNHLVSYCWARLYSMSIINQYDIRANEKMRLFEDFVFNIEYLAHAERVVFVNAPLYTYTINNGHVSVSMSIMDARSLIHDMGIFRQHAIGYFHVRGANGDKELKTIAKEVDHALIHYIYIFLVRTCRFATFKNFLHVRAEVQKIISSSIYHEMLPHYTPQKGNSRLLPVLTRLKWITLSILLCKYKAFKRYGKLNR